MLTDAVGVAHSSFSYICTANTLGLYGFLKMVLERAHLWRLRMQSSLNHYDVNTKAKAARALHNRIKLQNISFSLESLLTF